MVSARSRRPRFSGRRLLPGRTAGRHSASAVVSAVTIRRMWCVAFVAGSAAVGACRQDMFNQPKVRPLQSSTFFADGRASRPLPEDTVARGDLRSDELLYTGRIGGAEADTFPFPVTKSVLDRGQERFEIHCSPCHGRAGYGDGMIVQRGFKAPPSFHTDRLRQAPAGHFVGVMANGFGVMYDYRGRVSPEDRWAIAAYIRALQLSQNATAGDLATSTAAHPSGGDKP